jgi:hypothetical protein
MPLHFEAAHGSSIDRVNGLEIFRPRLVPRPEKDAIAYEYALYKGDVRHSISCIGMHVEVEEEDSVTDLFTLELSEGWILLSIAKLKKDLAIDGDEFTFVKGLAEGLVRVFQSRITIARPTRYVALADLTSLTAHGLTPSRDLHRLSNGQIILAEVALPSSPLGSTSP